MVTVSSPGCSSGSVGPSPVGGPSARTGRCGRSSAAPSRPGAFVVLLSALVSAEPLTHAVRLARSGHAVVVVDTLPPELTGPDATDDAVVAATGVDDPRLARLVWRLRLLDREREAHRCSAAGVPVLAWRGPGSLDTVLRQATRRSRGPRVVAR